MKNKTIYLLILFLTFGIAYNSFAQIIADTGAKEYRMFVIDVKDDVFYEYNALSKTFNVLGKEVKQEGLFSAAELSRLMTKFSSASLDDLRLGRYKIEYYHETNNGLDFVGTTYLKFEYVDMLGK